jgi:hypothetical protein
VSISTTCIDKVIPPSTSTQLLGRIQNITFYIAVLDKVLIGLLAPVMIMLGAFLGQQALLTSRGLALSLLCDVHSDVSSWKLLKSLFWAQKRGAVGCMDSGKLHCLAITGIVLSAWGPAMNYVLTNGWEPVRGGHYTKHSVEWFEWKEYSKVKDGVLNEWYQAGYLNYFLQDSPPLANVFFDEGKGRAYVVPSVNWTALPANTSIDNARMTVLEISAKCEAAKSPPIPDQKLGITSREWEQEESLMPAGEDHFAVGAFRCKQAQDTACFHPFIISVEETCLKHMSDEAVLSTVTGVMYPPRYYTTQCSMSLALVEADVGAQPGHVFYVRPESSQSVHSIPFKPTSGEEGEGYGVHAVTSFLIKEAQTAHRYSLKSQLCGGDRGYPGSLIQCLLAGRCPGSTSNPSTGFLHLVAHIYSNYQSFHVRDTVGAATTADVISHNIVRVSLKLHGRLAGILTSLAVVFVVIFIITMSCLSTTKPVVTGAEGILSYTFNRQLVAALDIDTTSTLENVRFEVERCVGKLVYSDEEKEATRRNGYELKLSQA